jgi:uncharacterized protein YndB with AHSA1/START domain
MDPSDDHVVRLTRVLRAPPDDVFAAWTETALLERWWAGVGGWVEAKADVDLRVGGGYHFSMRDESGAQHGLFGSYTAVARPERVAFTWNWENEPPVMRGSEGSLVEVGLRDAPGGTELTLTHSSLGSKVVTDLHEEGWNALLTSLFGFLS